MAHPFIYFLSGIKAAKGFETAKAKGLGYAFDVARPAGRDTAKGPDGTPGCCLAASENVQHVGFWPEETKPMRWLELPDHDGCWLGWYTDERRPTPEILQRPDPLFIGGYPVEIGGESWIIPQARQYVEIDGGELTWIDSLPRKLRYLGGSQWEEGDVRERHARLWKLAQEYEELQRSIAEQMETASGEIATYTYDDANVLALEAITTNYRLGPTELESLDLLDETSRLQILRALTDTHTLEAWIRKKKQDNSAATAGDVSLSGQTESKPAQPAMEVTARP